MINADQVYHTFTLQLTTRQVELLHKVMTLSGEAGDQHLTKQSLIFTT